MDFLDIISTPKEKVKVNQDIPKFNNKKRSILEEVANGSPNQNVKRTKYSLSTYFEKQCSKSLESKITSRHLKTEGCIHEVAYPVDLAYQEINKELSPTPARTFDFPKLDPFQREAIICIESNQSVLVSAHTSSGKTAVAEYAIAQALKNNQKVIYTTPIKALSNQKYREFCQIFRLDGHEDVGLITGDVTINKTANCLIMTTEVLRNILYQGDKLISELGWVIFDEIHYMRDKERGVVWEESIIMLLPQTQLVFLSATIPNALQFAEWIATIHHKACHVVYTDYRPIPLHQYVLPSGNSDSLHLVVDGEGKLLEGNLKTAVDKVSSSGQGRHDRFQTGADTCCRAIKTICDNNLTPVIAFSFSRKDCDRYSTSLKGTDLNSKDEKSKVVDIYTNAISLLSDADKNLPQVTKYLPLIKRGIAVHHSGLLPIIKEIIEILFSEGLIKVLFATETFAMGLNMPAKTVLFTGLKKFDGVNFRLISSGEYIQMSGRAGRRGLDKKGTVIITVDQEISCESVKLMLKGQSDPMNSAFYISNGMILSLMRREGFETKLMIEKSFKQYQNSTVHRKIYKAYQDLEFEYSLLTVDKEEEVRGYHCLKKNLKDIEVKLEEYIYRPEVCRQFLNHGRIVRVEHNSVDFKYGFVHSCNNTYDVSKKMNVLTVKVLLHCQKNDSKDINNAVPPTSDDIKKYNDEMRLFDVDISCIKCISTNRAKTLPQDLDKWGNRKKAYSILISLKKQFADDLPVVDPNNPNLNINDPEFIGLKKKLITYQKDLNALPIASDPNLLESLEVMEKKENIENQVKELEKQYKEIESSLNFEELEGRKKVLQSLGLSDNSEAITFKGKVACELTCSNELLLSEMLLQGMFIDLNPQQIVSLLSCLVCQEKLDKEESGIPIDLQKSFDKMIEQANAIGQKCFNAGIIDDSKAITNELVPNMMYVAYEWSKGKSFAEILGMTDIFEGSIIRTLRRLEDLIRQLSSAAKMLGNIVLENKFTDAIGLIKRDIVFAASLYL